MNRYYVVDPSSVCQSCGHTRKKSPGKVFCKACGQLVKQKPDDKLVKCTNCKTT